MTSFAPQSRAESLSVTSSPPGANVEIAPLVFSTRLDHSMILRVSKDGYSTQQIALTDGPFERPVLDPR
jgi:hypothetical protein